MNTTTWRLCMSASVAAALLAGCAALEPQEVANFTPSGPGSTWQMNQKNTGSYGKDAEVVMTRGEDTWQGNKVITVTMSNTGARVMMLPDGRWTAIVARDGKPMFTYDPPIGYAFPLKVGKTWRTQHKVTNHMAGRVAEIDYNCIVESRERVTVPAGTFDAFRIACENEYSRDVSWYSADAGVHVKQDMRRKAANPSGQGTQQSELVALSR